MQEHDKAYRNMFAFPEMVEGLMRDFVSEDWIAQIDFTTLENCNSTFISDDLHERRDDIIWRVRLNDEWFYIYLLLEFQSKNDPWMALRIMVYIGLLYQHLIKTEVIKTGDKLPPVFPLVLYNGESRWTAARDMADLLQPMVGHLASYRPSLRYYLIDECKLSRVLLEQVDSFAAAVIRVENYFDGDPKSIYFELNKLTQKVNDSKNDSLNRAITVWVNRVLYTSLQLAKHQATIAGNFVELKEIKTMLSLSFENWQENFRQECEQKGEVRGKLEGQAATLKRQLTKRFGPLSQETQNRIANASLEQIETWSDRVLDAPSLATVLETH